MRFMNVVAGLIAVMGCVGETAGEVRGSDAGMAPDADRVSSGPADAGERGMDASSIGIDAPPEEPERPTGGRVTAVVRELVASDTHQGWSSIVYVPTIRRFLSIFINHYSPRGWQNNSLRAFDPETDTVEYVHPRDVPGAPQDRDNHQMVYNPFRDEVWILSGNSGLRLDVAEAWSNRAAPPSYGAVGWDEELGVAEFAATVGVTGWDPDFRRWNAAVDWHHELDVGVIFMGQHYTGGPEYNDLYVVRPTGAAPGESYEFEHVANFDDVLPAGYDAQRGSRHNGRILDDHFYAVTLDESTVTPSGDGFDVEVDLWRYDLRSLGGSLERMAPLRYHASTDYAGYGTRFSCMTADSNLGVLLLYLTTPDDNLYAYLADRDEWARVEVDVPAPQRDLSACDYSPDHGMHVYQDGLSEGRDSLGWGTIALSRGDG